MPEPDLLRIPCEHDRFTDVGRYGDGCQFMAFVTGAFRTDHEDLSDIPDSWKKLYTEPMRWYAVLHRFDAEGNHLGTEARLGGINAPKDSPRDYFRERKIEAMDRAEEILQDLLASLGPCQHGDIWVKPFRVEIDGCLFGLIYEEMESDEPDFVDPDFVDTEGHVMLEPNDVMFHPPWDSGNYST